MYFYKKNYMEKINLIYHVNVKLFKVFKTIAAVITKGKRLVVKWEGGLYYITVMF